MKKSGKVNDLVIGYILVALSAICFGIMPVLAKVAYNSGEGTTTLLFLRFGIGGSLLFFFNRTKKAKSPSRKNIFALFLLGALGYTGQSFCYFTALEFASASLVALLLYVYPALVIFISAIFLHEKITSSKMIALVCALVGCMLILGFKGEKDARGMGLALASAAIYAIYIICSSMFVEKETASMCSAIIMLSASFSFAVILGCSKGFQLPKTGKGILATIAIALFSTVVAFWAFFSGLGRIGPTDTSLVSTLEPLVTVLCAMLFLGERLSSINILGGVCIILSLIVSAFPSYRSSHTL
ncbi:MAG: DMT family transporter [Spirochaetia bacterium]|jgi:drug/metabolite transporter (DMT)-like permease|nr:DMT family transporter [Spirochaetia bacterium]